MASVRYWRCVICGFIAEGEKPPLVCPVCGATSEYFKPWEPPQGWPAKNNK